MNTTKSIALVLLTLITGISFANEKQGWHFGAAAAFDHAGQDASDLSDGVILSLFAERFNTKNNRSWFIELGHNPNMDIKDDDMADFAVRFEVTRLSALAGMNFYNRSKRAYLTTGVGFNQYRARFSEFSNEVEGITAALGGGFNLIGGLDVFARYEYTFELSGADSSDRYSQVLIGLRYTF